ncbi:Oxidoreductase family, NAD-binding Rossmann fold [Anatilimnocola aggregata]|uniref:Oxidoreductase family, NAD-binding Rossmann fold n=1 Tax=Anatilimnocola aggregata TaxID=2528021 RepID=A0A517YIP0_9BACT|nr:Gfo/Idh/MocA family oxidoreductase [Anatilimnocola aggregata]QDU30097.1 Oxidoreductase family, NAD-binding Rossmann fold [Anatilimnocola aggregata]
MLSRLCFAFLIALFMPATFVAAQDVPAKPPVRVGVLGLDNYQAVAYSQLFNSPKAEGDLAGLKVVAALPIGSEKLPLELKDIPRWQAQIGKYGVEMVDSVDELLKRSDVIMVMTMDGRDHLKQIEPVLRAGKPVYIGRPFAASLADAIAIMKLAEETKTPCWSSSQHRFSPGFSGMKDHPEVGKVIGCDVYGGCTSDPSTPEFFWSALHSIETLYAIMGPGVTSVTCTSTPTAEQFTAVWADGRVGTYRGIKEGKVKYSATVFGDKGVSTAGVYGHGVPVGGIVPTKDKYMGYEGIAIEMAKFFKGAPVPVSPAETIELFTFLQAAEESKAAGGKTVRLDEVLKKHQAKIGK